MKTALRAKIKSETLDMLKTFYTIIKRQFNVDVKKIRSDNGTEFTNSSFQRYIREEGIVHETSCVGAPQQNARVERKHWHILNVARALRFEANLPIHFWGECVLTATHLINRAPTIVNSNITPYEMLYGKPPSYDHLRIFGSLGSHDEPKTYAQVMKHPEWRTTMTQEINALEDNQTWMKLGPALISWKTKKQSTVYRSSNEVEYRVIAHATSEIIWLRSLLKNLQVDCDSPIFLHCDNQVALHLAASPIFHEQTKHIEVNCHFIRNHLEKGTITTSYIFQQKNNKLIFSPNLWEEKCFQN
uniref:Retrovirus-related Pol polyprotein from transposon TNT 1-94 n=1 Tax=Cajanus cajan TaxID=3821 RepID=A0A151R3Z9_CAJCA|nr:Retrovirus-related Pol polyprotein from transposon TNT 1-94 [Cajanus cajan]